MDKSRKETRSPGEIPDVLHPFIEDKNETEGKITMYKTLDSLP
jgi:hypothetical protein